jgi:hypothetical protein
VGATPDIVTLQFPKGYNWLPVVRIVLGGVAMRQDLRLDELDDLKLAVETLLVEEGRGEGQVTLRAAAQSDRLAITITGLSNPRLRRSLENEEGARAAHTINIRMLLDSLVDEYCLVNSDQGSFGVEMDKRLAAN